MSAELNVSLRLLLDQVANDSAKAAGIIKQQLGAAFQSGLGGKTPTQAASKDAAEIARAFAQGAQATSKMKSDLDKISSGGGNLGAFKKFPEALKKAILAQHPEIAASLEKTVETVVEKTKAKFRGYGMASLPAILKAQVPIVPNALGQTVKGTMFGLRDITGKDLAKVHALGIFGQEVAKSGIDFKKYGMGNRPNFGFASPNSPSFMQNPDFFKTVAKLNLGKILLGIGVGAAGNPFIGSRLLSDELGKNAKQGGVSAGLFGKGGIMGFAEIYLGFKAFSFVMGHLAKSVENLNRTIHDANSRYAKSLTSGFSLGFSIRRNVMADILGVSEQDVLKFAGSLNQFGANVDLATKALVGSTRNLTSVQQQKNVVAVNRSAFDQEVARTYSGIAYLNAKSDVAGTALDLKIRRGFNNLLDKLHLLAPAAPLVLQRMNQLGTSTWEKMGLVVGGSGHSTNDLIKVSNKHLSVIAAALTGPNWKTKKTPFGMQSVPNSP